MVSAVPLTSVLGAGYPSINKAGAGIDFSGYPTCGYGISSARYIPLSVLLTTVLRWTVGRGDSARRPNVQGRWSCAVSTIDMLNEVALRARKVQIEYGSINTIRRRI